MAEQQYIDYGNTANDGTGDSLREAFIKVDDNFTSIWDAGPVGSNIVITNNTIASTNLNGDIIVAPSGIGVVRINGTMVPRTSNAYSMGTANARFRAVYVGSGGIDITGDLTVGGNIIGNIAFANTIEANIFGSVYGNYSNNYAVLVDAETGTHYGAFVGDASGLVNIPNGSFVSNGTSIINVQNSGPITASVGNVANVMVITQTAVAVTGNITATQKISAVEFIGSGAQLTSTLTDRGNDTNDWNTLTQMGVYKVNRVSWSGTQGTPLDSAVYVGILQVLTANDATTQIFLPGTVEASDQKIQWNRSYWNGSWTVWIKIVNNGQVVDAGTF